MYVLHQKHITPIIIQPEGDAFSVLNNKDDVIMASTKAVTAYTRGSVDLSISSTNTSATMDSFVDVMPLQKKTYELFDLIGKNDLKLVSVIPFDAFGEVFLLCGV